MRLWLSLATALGLLLLCEAEYKPLEPCPHDRICLIFTDDACYRHGAREDRRGHIWDANTKCDSGTYGFAHARLDIQPLHTAKWKVTATIITDYLYNKWFDFETAKLHFSVGKTTFSWKEGDTSRTSTSSLTSGGSFNTDYYGGRSKTAQRYEFEIEADGKNLTNLIGSVVQYKEKATPISMIVNDTELPDLIDGLSMPLEHRRLESCPDTRVCFIFVQNESCTTNGNEFPEPSYTGYAWNANTICRNPTYGMIYARLDIFPLTTTKWRMLTTVYEMTAKMGYNFVNAKIDFVNSEWLKFTWKREGKESSSDIRMRHSPVEDTFVSTDRTASYVFKRYSFEIEAGGENLTDFIGPSVNYHYIGSDFGLNDTELPEKIRQLKTPPEHRQLEPCPENKACIIFVQNDACASNGEFPEPANSGFVWTSNSTCNRPTYEILYTRLEIQPITPKKWSVVTTSWENPLKQKINEIGFNFGKAHFEFLNEKRMKVTWNRNGSESATFHPMSHNHRTDVFVSENEHTSWTFKRYSFEIEAYGEDLIDFFESEVNFNVKGKLTAAVNDTKYTQELKAHTEKLGQKPNDNTLLLVLGIGGGIILILIVLIVIAVCCYCSKRKARLHDYDARNTYRPITSKSDPI